MGEGHIVPERMADGADVRLEGVGGELDMAPEPGLEVQDEVVACGGAALADAPGGNSVRVRPPGGDRRILVDKSLVARAVSGSSVTSVTTAEVSQYFTSPTRVP